MATLSKARLRTRTGCLACRKRRKKCDEHLPRCAGCQRNGLECIWPTAAGQPVDGRQRRFRFRHWEDEDSSNITGLSVWSSALGRLPFPSNDHFRLYQHFATTITSRLVRQNCRSEYADQSYMLQLALEFPPLMGAMVAIAALDMDTPYHVCFAEKNYLLSLQSLRNRLAGTPNAGVEDAVLATTITLCVLENCRSDAPMNTGVHATAAGVLLALRRRRLAQTQTSPQSTDIFERLCAESFLYHSSLMMLFDHSLDVQHHNGHLIDLDQCFPNFADDITPSAYSPTQPVLDVSYKFFLLIADVTRLARIAHPLHASEIHAWTQLQVDLSCWEVGDESGHHHSVTLYVLAMRILLLKVDPGLSARDVSERMHVLLQQGLLIVDALDVHRYLATYLLWPLAVLGSVSVNRGEQVIIETKISALLCRKRQGLGVWVRNRLEQIWASKGPSQSTVVLVRLRMLLEGFETVPGMAFCS